MTTIRKKILEILQQSTRPLSAKEILVSVQAEIPTAHKTTIYRDLTFFLAQGMIVAVSGVPGVICYELKTNHHHHFVCDACTQIYDVPCIDEKLHAETIRIPSDFLVKESDIIFRGICHNCH